MCVGDCDGHGKGFACEVGRLRGHDNHTESGVGDVTFGHGTSEGGGKQMLETFNEVLLKATRDNDMTGV